MPPEDKIQTILFGGIMSTLAAMVTAMLSKDGNVWDRVKTFIAGVCCGILLTLIFMNTNISQVWKDIISTSSAAFVSTFWPTIGRLWISFVEKYVKKKSDDIIPKS